MSKVSCTCYYSACHKRVTEAPHRSPRPAQTGPVLGPISKAASNRFPSSLNGFAIERLESLGIFNYELQMLNDAKQGDWNQRSKSPQLLLVVSALTIYATPETANVLSPNTN